MHFAGSAASFPPPPTPDEVAAGFRVPLVGFAPQAALEESGVATTTSTRGDGSLDEASASLTYTLWRNPADRADPVNLADLSPELAASLAAPVVPDAPAWVHEAREHFRYPMIWEAVRTTARGTSPRDLDELLTEHVSYVLMNVFRETRSAGRFPATVTDAPAAVDLVDTTVDLDGTLVAARALDTDLDVLAVGAALDDDAVFTAVVAREWLPHLDWRFARRR